MVTKKNEEPMNDPWENGTNESAPGWAAPQPPARDLLTITMKSNSAWIVLHASSVAEGIDVLEHDDLPYLMELAAQREADFSKEVKAVAGPPQRASNGSGNSGWGNQSKGGSRGSQRGSGGRSSGKVSNGECAHGEAIYKSGRNDKGDYEGYVCPDGICKAEWL